MWNVWSGMELQGHQHADVLEHASATSVHRRKALMLDPSPHCPTPMKDAALHFLAWKYCPNSVPDG
ncbi:hypothetical protein DPMN_132904 [Dreissena polymorpha]|uniref:Uncharacterized protein n=1 Tax=Dreissena polymorpha TaxID=45954 RepID=A0A9D4FXI9_DREPO|nr:hypothetical protein DPMN_132904 [Dreissena polymorpha]